MANNLYQFINKRHKNIPIDESGSFNFTCAKQCWGTCCREEHVGLLQLSVYDVYSLLNLKPNVPVLDLIQVKIDEETNLPRVFIKWTKDKVCPNLNEDGTCGVYEHRPFACRIFPLEGEFMINDETKSIAVKYTVKENVCFGFHKEANPENLNLETFLKTPDFENHLKYELLEISLRDQWIKKYDLKNLKPQQTHMLAQVLYCLKEKIIGKNVYFFDFYSEALKIPKRIKRLESLTADELSKLALEEFAPRLLEKFNA